MTKFVHTTSLFVSMTLLACGAVASDDTTKLTETIKTTTLNTVNAFADSIADSLTSDSVKHLEVSITEDDSKAGGEALAVIKLRKADDSFTFTQLSVTRRYEDTTANIGVGYRQLTADGTVIMGINAFADNELSSGHQRAGLGLEYLSLAGSLHFNHYAGLSGEKTVKGVVEKAMTGSDLAYSYKFHNVAYQPTVSLRGFEWKGDAGYKVSGTEAGLGLNLSNNMKLDMFYKDESKSKSETRAQLSFILPIGADKVELETEASSDSAALRSMMYQPVKRQNHIKKTTVNLGIVFTTG